MFFSANQLYAALCNPVVGGFNGGHYTRSNNLTIPGTIRPCKKRVRAHVKRMKTAIVNRQTGMGWVGKWLRPWDIVPALRNFQAPDGQFGVGVEIELGFQSLTSARAVAAHIQHWRHVAIDSEGGDYPIEATFPPIVYSKFNSRCQVANYLKFLNSTGHVNREELAASNYIGTHVNVSKGGNTIPSRTMFTRCEAMNNVLGCYIHHDDNIRYFGRERPYGYANWQERFFEFKMFKSTTDFKAVKRYVNVAVALADLLYSDRVIDQASVREALEAGYNKRV